MDKKMMERIWNRLNVMLLVPFREKTFLASNGERLHYLFFPSAKSGALVIVFQAFHDKEARYNYVQTLNGIPAARLYIKDDFSRNRRGSYYLGSGGTYSVETAVHELIDRYKKECTAQKLIFVGSSKGGYSAVNFGIQYEGSDMVIAAPQYYIGSYLSSDKFRENLEDIIGTDRSEEKIRALDARLGEKVRQDSFGDSQRVYIHYSVREHTYEEHVKDLLRDLSAQGIRISENVENYAEHMDLKYYFPEYLKRCLKEILSE